MSETRPRSIYAVAAGAIFATAAVVLWTRINPEQRPQFVDLTAAPAAARAPVQHAVRFAVAPVWAPERTLDVHYDLARYVARAIGRPLRVVQRRTFGEVNELLRRRGVDAAIIGTGTYLLARRDDIALDVIAVPVVAEGPMFHSVIVVKSDSPLRSLDDLEGRTIGFSDPLSISGHYYPISVIVARGKDPHTYFARSVFTYGHFGSIRAVLDGIVDAAAINSLSYDFEGPRTDLRVIHRSPPFAISPVVVPRVSEPRFVAALTRALLTMHTTNEGLAILHELHLTRFEAPPPGLYDDAARIVDTVLRQEGASQ